MNDHLAGPATRAPLKRKSAILAVALQCLPLLFLGSIIAYLRLPGFRETFWSPDSPLSLFQVLLGFLWGVGYAYLGRAKRFVLTLPLGALLGLLFSCGAFPVSFMRSLPCQVLIESGGALFSFCSLSAPLSHLRLWWAL